MKIKLKELLEIRPALAKLLSQPMPVKAAYWLGKGVKRLNSEFQDFEDNRLQLIKSMGESILDKEGKDTGQVQVKADNLPEFNKALEELISIEVKVDIKPVKLGDLKDASLSPLEMASLEKFIQEK